MRTEFPTEGAVFAKDRPLSLRTGVKRPCPVLATVSQSVPSRPVPFPGHGLRQIPTPLPSLPESSRFTLPALPPIHTLARCSARLVGTRPSPSPCPPTRSPEAARGGFPFRNADESVSQRGCFRRSFGSGRGGSAAMGKQQQEGKRRRGEKGGKRKGTGKAAAAAVVVKVPEDAAPVTGCWIRFPRLRLRGCMSSRAKVDSSTSARRGGGGGGKNCCRIC